MKILPAAGSQRPSAGGAYFFCDIRQELPDIFALSLQKLWVQRRRKPSRRERAEVRSAVFRSFSNK